MAIEIEIPKDITKYEAKLMGPFTTRQIVCLVPAVLLAIATYNVGKKFVTQDTCYFLVLIVISPFLLCGWYKPYGMPFEKFIKTAFVSNILSPKHRKYITKNVYEEIYKINDATQRKEIKKENKKENKKETKKENNKKQQQSNDLFYQ